MLSNKTPGKAIADSAAKNCKFKETGVECQFLHIPDYHIIPYRFKAYAYIYRRSLITLRSREF